MKATSNRTLLAGLVTLALAIAIPVVAQPAGLTKKDADSKSQVRSEPKASTTARPLPFRGKLTSVDKVGRSITVGARIFHIESETKLYRGASKLPATLNDAAIGEQVTGSYIKETDGKLTARSVYFGSRAPSKGEEKKPETKNKQNQR